MKKVIYILLGAIMFPVLAQGQQVLTQAIRGSVSDAVTGYPLPGAYVILTDTVRLNGTVTDANGQYVLKNVPLGRQSIQVSFMGYETKIISNLLVESGKETLCDIKLEEKATGLGEVVVKAESKKSSSQNDLAMVSARTFSVEETERFAGSLGDPARLVANYAGVMTQNDSRNDIIIRGNSPAGVLWRMEGIEIPNPNHFAAQGTTGGPVSMVNNNLLANSDFLTGAFPAEYSNALAGVFDLNMRSGNSSKHEYTGQIGFNGFEGGLEGPLWKTASGQKGSYLLNYRYSTLDLISKLGFNIGTGAAIPEYQDLTFLIDLPGTKAGRFKLIGLWGKSFIGLGRDLADTTGNQYNQASMATDFGADLGVIGLTHTYFFNENIRLKSTLSWQRAHSIAKLDSIISESFMPYIRQNQAENKLSFSTQLKIKMNSDNNLSFGLIIDRFNVNYLDSIHNADIHRFVTTTDTKGNLLLIRGYGQWQHKFGDKTTAYYGLNLQYFDLNREFTAEPRISFRYSLSSASNFNLGLGLHSQVQPKSVYFFKEYDELTSTYTENNRNLKSTKSAHVVLGYQLMLSNELRLKAETYYQYLYKVPVKESFPEYSLLNTGDQFGLPGVDSLVNKGTGRNYGVELTFEKFLSKGWYFLFTTSLFDSKYRGYDKVLRNTAFNGNYVFNLLGGYEHRIGKNSMLTVDLKTVWAGGKRYLPIDLAESVSKMELTYDWSAAYQNKYSDYFRTDIRIGIKLNSRKFSQEWGVDLQNITGYRSIFMEGFDGNKKAIYKVYQQGFLPMVLYRVRF